MNEIIGNNGRTAVPALSPKHEQFVQLVVRGVRYGWTQGEAYQRAGFRATGHAAETNCQPLC